VPFILNIEENSKPRRKIMNTNHSKHSIRPEIVMSVVVTVAIVLADVHNSGICEKRGVVLAFFSSSEWRERASSPHLTSHYLARTHNSSP
jgi:hypothetical protein